MPILSFSSLELQITTFGGAQQHNMSAEPFLTKARLVVLFIACTHWSVPGMMLICMMQGASEIVLRSCTQVVSADGSIIPLNSTLRAELEETTTDMAARGLRTLCMTYRDFPGSVERPADFFETSPDSELICCAITGIKASCCLANRPATSEENSLAAILLLLHIKHHFHDMHFTPMLSCCSPPCTHLPNYVFGSSFRTEGQAFIAAFGLLGLASP